MTTSMTERIKQVVWNTCGVAIWSKVYGHPCSKKNCEYHDTCKKGDSSCYRQELDAQTYKIIQFYDIPGGDSEGTCVDHGIPTREEAQAEANRRNIYSPEEVCHVVHREEVHIDPLL